MVYLKINAHKRNLGARLNSLDKNKNISKEEKASIKEFLRLASLGKINLRKKIGESRLLKYLDILAVPLSYFKKDLDKLTEKDIENFVQDLDKNKIKKLKPTNKKELNYSDSTKSDIKRILKIYLKWRFQDEKKFNELTNWIDTTEKKKTPEYLKEDEIIKLYRACKTPKQRFLIAVLFDLGCRAEEFLNIRFEDVQEPNSNFSYYKIHLKEEYSKTKGRNIGLYWKYSTEAMGDYFKEFKSRPKDPIYSDNYDTMRMFLSRLGKKVLNKRIYPHLFRHSSATFYASKMNRQQLCLRYGWSFTSRMPDVYISRAGLEEEEIGEKIKNTDIAELKERLEKAEHLLKIVLDKGMDSMRKVEEGLKAK